MKKIVVGLSGASGMPLAIKLLKELKKYQCEIHLVATKGALMTLKMENNKDADALKSLCDHYYENDNIGAAIASGTFKNDGMIIVLCSMKTIAGIAHGYSDNLLLRSADVMIKEKRKLVLAVRETPLSAIHLDNMAYLAKLQNIYIMPLVMSYYNRPQNIEDMEYHLIGKILDVFDLDIARFNRWQ